MQAVFDPLRHKEVVLTPEEQVRQWFISVLRDQCRVPLHMMMSEASFMYGQKRYRADILIYDRTGKAVAVVECKRPDVEIGAAVAEQAMRYNMVLDVQWILLTNGGRTLVFRRMGDVFTPSVQLPDYETMICRQ